MALAEQSQQWYPTSVQVTVLQARNLRVKGKNGTNDAYAIIQVAKDKFSTAVMEKCVEPVWKEEAAFDLPLFHHGNVDRCTLYIIVMHRATVGMDKLLGQAVINLVDEHEKKNRKKPDWYKLVDKGGKTEKERGEVLLDIQFMRNNMTASMFDLSMPDKPRSRIAKIKDKVRGKKRDGFSDSSSAIVPATVGQILTDSEGEGETRDSPKLKKSSKFKSLFGSKTNLHRGVSQSMSTLGTLPEKNSSLTSSRSSGLNEEFAEGKSKFKILGHKRNSSTDSKISLGPFTLLNRSKPNISDQNNLCINGSHVYAEDQEKGNFGSSLSLSGSTKGSIEDLRKYHERNASAGSVDSFKGLSIPSYKPDSTEREFQGQQHPQEDDEKKHGRLQELVNEQERKRQEDEGKLQQERQRKRLEEEEQQRKRREEETKKSDEQKRQEESRVTDRLTSLFGLGRKKEEQILTVESPKQLKAPGVTNPFEEIPLGSENQNVLEEKPSSPQSEFRPAFTPMPPSSSFPASTAKVSAVKPRLPLSLKTETDNTDSIATPIPSDYPNPVSSSNFSPEASPSSESFNMFSNLHSSLAPPKPERTFLDSPTSPQPPTYPGDPFKIEKHHPRNEILVNSPTSEKSQRPLFPLPDYEALFPRKRHGVMTDTRWEHIIAEVNQRKIDFKGSTKEMSVDGPEVCTGTTSSDFNQASSSSFTKEIEPKQFILPPKSSDLATSTQPLEPIIEQDCKQLYSVQRDNTEPSVQKQQDTNAKKTLNQIPDPTLGQISLPRKEKPIPTARKIKGPNSPSDQSSAIDTTVLNLANHKQETPSEEPVRQVQPEENIHAFTFSATSQVERIKEGSLRTKGSKERKPIPVNRTNKTVELPKDQPFASFDITSASEKRISEFDPFPNDKLICHDPWALPLHPMEDLDFFTFGQKNGKLAEDQRLSSDDFDHVFGSVTTNPEMDPFFVLGKDKANVFLESVASKNKINSKNSNPSSQKFHSQGKKPAPQPPVKPEMAKDTVERPDLQEADDLSVYKGGKAHTGLDLFTPVPELLSGDVAGGKGAICAWVSPSESGTSQSSGGGGVLTSRRPHPVKPLGISANSSIGKDLKIPTIREVAEKKSVDCGPFTQLTQEELITLVVKQQTELSKKDEKIVELEDYIDHLLVRVIEEQPSILLSMESKA